MANDNDDWEVAVDTGEFDKRLEQQEKARAANQEPIMPVISSTNDDDNRNLLNMNLINSNKPIRILKRPTSQTQLPTMTNVSKTSSTMNSNEIDGSNSSISTNTSSLATTVAVPNVSIVQRIQTRDSANSSTIQSNSQTAKPAIKTYEQRELEYRLARLRIMGEEESSIKDDDETPSSESTTNPSDDPSKSITSPSTSSSISSTARLTNKINAPPQVPLQSLSTPGSYASNLYTLNNTQPTGAIQFTPHNNSTPNIGPGPYSSPNMPQNFRGPYSVPYSHMSRYPLPSTNTSSSYMSSQIPYMNVPPPSSSSTTTTSSSSSSSFPYTPQQYSNVTNNNWYNYSHPSAPPSGAPTFGHPQ